MSTNIIAEFAAKTISDKELVNPFVREAQQVFETMFQSHCSPGEMQPVVDGRHLHRVTAVVSLSGGLWGATALSMPDEVACRILERFVGIPAREVDESVRDALGEAVNMIGGKGKRELSRFELQLGLPQVIVGDDTVLSPLWAKNFWVPLKTDLGDCTLAVGFDLPQPASQRPVRTRNPVFSEVPGL